MALGGNATLRMVSSKVLGNVATIAGGGLHIEGGNYDMSQISSSVHNNKAPLVADVVMIPKKIAVINSSSLDNFVSRLGADDGILNVTILASGQRGVACPGLDVAAAILERGGEVYVLTTQKTGSDGKVHMRVKLRRPPGVTATAVVALSCCLLLSKTMV